MTTAPTGDRNADDGDAERRDAVHALEGSFAELMTVFRQYMARAAEAVSPGLLPATFKALSTISRTGPVTLSELTERLTVDKGFLSRSISELEALGLVTRTADPADRRSRLIAVTDEGERRLAVARAPHEGRLFTVLEDWSIDDIRHLTTLLHALASASTP